MILIDDRIGSKDLVQPLQRAGVPCELQRLPFADCAFIGRGINGKDIYIGVELKETRDLIASMKSSRFVGHQLPGLLNTYDRVWLVTEGIWRSSDDGVMEIMAGGWRPVSVGNYRISTCDVESWILSQVVRGGIQHWHCSTRKDTLRFLTVLHHWWTNKDLDEHRSHEAIYQPPPDRAWMVEPSIFCKMAANLPGVGWERAIALEEACGGSMSALVKMSAMELLKVDGIGKITAARIVSTLTPKREKSPINP